MAETRIDLSLYSFFWALFVAIKLAGHALATWSWWWMLIPIVPIFGLLVQKAGL